MGRKSRATVRNAKIPKHLTKIAMTPEQYYELKVYIKSIILPGTPAFEYEHLSSKEIKQNYHQWFKNTLEVIGPKFFQGGSKGLVWPEDYNRIYKAIHQVVRALSIGIRKSYKKKEVRAVHEGAGGNEMEMTQDHDHYDGKDADDTDEEDVILNEDEKYAQWEGEEEKMMAMMMGMSQENQVKDTSKGMDVEPIELEDLLGLMTPKMFAHFPDLDNEYFDWDEIIDPSSPEPVSHLANLARPMWSRIPEN
ncbi:hypothetical protein B9Z19DRAFT_1134599 [Tuber borchii]|uniref:Uncharacterized protein n=1 Tax=Tuber borchii TaxID=42251 RepID=A0A2T6ZDZ0_TUBBO|nr:hypothetical protein B9Z19DRAFT_1134599 [Tuber borchii]